jgi:hypothetical protein
VKPLVKKIKKSDKPQEPFMQLPFMLAKGKTSFAG